MNDVSSRAYIHLLAQFVNSVSPFVILLAFLWVTLIVSIPTISIITGDFNGKCLKWYSFDTSDNIGKELDTVYSQIIGNPTHFTNNSSSCIDHIFTSNPSIIVDSGIEKSLCSSYHHDIMHGKINFPHPPPHFRAVWD